MVEVGRQAGKLVVADTQVGKKADTLAACTRADTRVGKKADTLAACTRAGTLAACILAGTLAGTMVCTLVDMAVAYTRAGMASDRPVADTVVDTQALADTVAGTQALAGK